MDGPEASVVGAHACGELEEVEDAKETDSLTAREPPELAPQQVYGQHSQGLCLGATVLVAFVMVGAVRFHFVDQLGPLSIATRNRSWPAAAVAPLPSHPAEASAAQPLGPVGVGSNAASQAHKALDVSSSKVTQSHEALDVSSSKVTQAHKALDVSSSKVTQSHEASDVSSSKVTEFTGETGVATLQPSRKVIVVGHPSTGTWLLELVVAAWLALADGAFAHRLGEGHSRSRTRFEEHGSRIAVVQNVTPLVKRWSAIPGALVLATRMRPSVALARGSRLGASSCAALMRAQRCAYLMLDHVSHDVEVRLDELAARGTDSQDLTRLVRSVGRYLGLLAPALPEEAVKAKLALYLSAPSVAWRLGTVTSQEVRAARLEIAASAACGTWERGDGSFTSNNWLPERGDSCIGGSEDPSEHWQCLSKPPGDLQQRAVLARHNIVFIKSGKTGSTTWAGVVRRVSIRLDINGAREDKYCFRDPSVIHQPAVCANHGKRAEMPAWIMKDAVMLASIREPVSRSFSFWAHIWVGERKTCQIDDSSCLMQYLNRAECCEQQTAVEHRYLAPERYGPKQWSCSSCSFEKDYENAQADSAIISDARGVLSSYHHIFVTERAVESVYVFMERLGLHPCDVLYVTGIPWDHAESRPMFNRTQHPGVMEWIFSPQTMWGMRRDRHLHALAMLELECGLARIPNSREKLGKFRRYVAAAQEACVGQKDCLSGHSGCAFHCLSSFCGEHPYSDF